MSVTNDPSKASITTEKMARHWPMLDALMGGTLAMRDAGKSLLPQWPAEDDKSYKKRLSVSVLYPAFSRTVRVMAAKPFSDESIFKCDFPDRISSLKSNCDLLGTDIGEFFADRMIDCLSHGLVGVCVDYSGKQPAKTLKDEIDKGYRPYLKAYKCSSIIGFRLENNVLSMVRLKETVIEHDGDFAENHIDQIRVLRVGLWQTWRKNEKLEWVLHEEGVNSFKRIPFVFFYGTKLGFGIGETPLLDLAYLNVEHWQSSSDQQNILHVARVPVLFAKGLHDDENIVIGASTATRTTATDASLAWVEHSGKAIGSGRESILDLESRMISTGAELITKRTGNITATQVSSEDKANASILQNITEEFETSMRECIALAAELVGIKDYWPEGIELFKNFSTDGIESVNAILQSEAQQIITKAEARAELFAKGLFSKLAVEAAET